MAHIANQPFTKRHHSAPSKPNGKSKRRRCQPNEKFNYGNYPGYYGYRNRSGADKDARLGCLPEGLFVGKDVLDIGCNVGCVTISVARDYGARTIVGLDVDGRLIDAAKRSIAQCIRDGGSVEEQRVLTSGRGGVDRPGICQGISEIFSLREINKSCETTARSKFLGEAAAVEATGETVPKCCNETVANPETVIMAVARDSNAENARIDGTLSASSPVEESSVNSSSVNASSGLVSYISGSAVHSTSIIDSSVPPSSVISTSASSFSVYSSSVDATSASMPSACEHSADPNTLQINASDTSVPVSTDATQIQTVSALSSPELQIKEGGGCTKDEKERRDGTLSGRTLRDAFPFNIHFQTTDYVLKSDAELGHQRPEYDVILALSVTKWLHLSGGGEGAGDEGLKRAFRRMYTQLRAGGRLVLEPQPWQSYRRKKKVTDDIFRVYQSIQFRPEHFCDYLLSPEVGFSSCKEVGVPHNESKGFQRPIQIYTKH